MTVSELNPGGDTTISIKPTPSFMLPAKNLAEDKKPEFHAGKALAHQPWVKAPTITSARDGLGPLYNTRTCLVCHANGGRGHMPEDDQQLLFSNFLRLSIPGHDPVNGVIPEPTYGDQLQSQSIALSHQLRTHQGADAVLHKEVAPEGYVYVNWIESEFVYPDGHSIRLRKPHIEIRNLGYGDMHPKTLLSLRNAPPIHGMGLLEMIEQSDIDKNADPEDINQDGISGRVNISWDYEQNRPRAGRFGLKANKASVRFQIASALHGDMGISNPVFPTQSCTEQQALCNNSIHGNDENGLEITEELLSLMVNFNISIAVAERRQAHHPMVVQGRELFYRTGCNSCHFPSYTTKNDPEFPHLSQQEIWPYTDLLIHDMGEGLADGRSDYLASGSEWRTPPLWGVGLSEAVNGSKHLLHDGRARSIEEAILWHGGEAEQVKYKFTHLSPQHRQSLMAFVKSL
ncbi:MAG: di-heme oxidoredictase family protein [Gammaproteobacteria bacterium]